MKAVTTFGKMFKTSRNTKRILIEKHADVMLGENPEQEGETRGNHRTTQGYQMVETRFLHGGLKNIQEGIFFLPGSQNKN